MCISPACLEAGRPSGPIAWPVSWGWEREAEIQGSAAAPVSGSPGTDPGLLFPLLRSSEEVPFSGGTRPLSGSSFPGGLGGTRIRRRKMHFFFLISLPQRNLGGGQGRRKLWNLLVCPHGEGSQTLNHPPPPTPASLDPELNPGEMAIPQTPRR